MLKSYTEKEPQVSSPISVLAAETLDFNDPRASPSEFDEAKDIEIEGLKKRNT
jgi:hypothetical protein